MTTPTAPPSSSSSSKAQPQDSAVIIRILKEMGVHDYEPRVVHQLLDFSHRYVSTVLEDSLVYSTYACKKSVDLSDIELSVSKLSDKMFSSPPPKDVLIGLARSKNNIPLPAIKSHAGPRLPPEKHSLVSANYASKKAVKTTTLPTTPNIITFKRP
jgi:histone H3/H4